MHFLQFLSGEVDDENLPDFRDDLFSVQKANTLIFDGYEPGILKFLLWLILDDYAGLSK
jgi:hypothetical protein